jgi:hypothetical protein
MLASLLITLLASGFSYEFPKESTHYDVTTVFDGYLPVFGGIEANVRVKFGMKVNSIEEDKSYLGVEYSLLSTEIGIFDDETNEYSILPLGLMNVKEYFPDSKVWFDTKGQIKRTTAPDVETPVRLPGLHTKHLADVTFLLIEFPDKKIEKGDTWKYKRKLGESEVGYEVTYLGKSEKGEEFSLVVLEEFTGFEDINKNALKSKEGAYFEVKTTSKGKGKLIFSGLKGIILEAELTIDSVSAVLSIENEERSERKLRSSLNFKKRGS